MVRFWEKLPPVVILEAADRILDHAKAQAGTGRSPFNFASSHDSAAFGCVYELRLFQLLPVIQDLDPSRAQQLLRENPKTKSVLEQVSEDSPLWRGALVNLLSSDRIPWGYSWASGILQSQKRPSRRPSNCL